MYHHILGTNVARNDLNISIEILIAGLLTGIFLTKRLGEDSLTLLMIPRILITFHGLYRSPTVLFKEFSRSFPGLLNNIQGVRFFRHSLNCVPIILRILHSHVNKPIPVSANNVKPNGNSYMYPYVQRITPSAFPAWNLIFCLQ